MAEIKYKDPVRPINAEFLQGLEVLSNKQFSLPGAVCRGGDRDPRHTHLGSGVGEVVIYNHLATVRHNPTKSLYVVFKQTMDGLLMDQQDPQKYPKWLMDSKVKATELAIYIHTVKPPYDVNPSAVLADRSIMDPTRQTRQHKWLEEIKNDWVFDTLAHFLLKNNIITEEMYGR